MSVHVASVLAAVVRGYYQGDFIKYTYLQLSKVKRVHSSLPAITSTQIHAKTFSGNDYLICNHYGDCTAFIAFHPEPSSELDGRELGTTSGQQRFAQTCRRETVSL